MMPRERGKNKEQWYTTNGIDQQTSFVITQVFCLSLFLYHQCLENMLSIFFCNWSEPIVGTVIYYLWSWTNKSPKAREDSKILGHQIDASTSLCSHSSILTFRISSLCLPSRGLQYPQNAHLDGIRIIIIQRWGGQTSKYEYGFHNDHIGLNWFDLMILVDHVTWHTPYIITCIFVVILCFIKYIWHMHMHISQNIMVFDHN